MRTRVTPPKKHGIIIENLSKFDVKSIYNKGYLLRRYTYPSIEYTFSNKMVNNDNQHFCGGWSIEGMDLSNDALFDRVLCGLKPMAAIASWTNVELSKYIPIIDLNRFDILNYNYPKTNAFFLLIGVKGKLKDLFNLDTLESDYKKCGIHINTKKYQDYEIKDFFNDWDGGDLESKTPYWITGLILGYPIENTISNYKSI